MMKLVLSFVALSLVAVLLAACGGSSGSCDSSNSGSSNGSTQTVHMSRDIACLGNTPHSQACIKQRL